MSVSFRKPLGNCRIWHVPGRRPIFESSKSQLGRDTYQRTNNGMRRVNWKDIGNLWNICGQEKNPQSYWRSTRYGGDRRMATWSLPLCSSLMVYTGIRYVREALKMGSGIVTSSLHSRYLPSSETLIQNVGYLSVRDLLVSCFIFIYLCLFLFLSHIYTHI